MQKVFTLLISLVCATSLVLGQDTRSDYSGQQSREIKSLSSQEVQGYLAGQGMGFAKAAELNQYPGPKHVLELAEQLSLTKEQIRQTKKIYDDMKKEAVRQGGLFVEKERNLDQALAAQTMEERQLRSLISEIGQLKSDLRFVHLNAHLKMSRILSRGQIARYDEQRGYHREKKDDHHHPMNQQ